MMVIDASPHRCVVSSLLLHASLLACYWWQVIWRRKQTINFELSRRNDDNEASRENSKSISQQIVAWLSSLAPLVPLSKSLFGEAKKGVSRER